MNGGAKGASISYAKKKGKKVDSVMNLSEAIDCDVVPGTEEFFILFEDEYRLKVICRNSVQNVNF